MGRALARKGDHPSTQTSFGYRKGKWEVQHLVERDRNETEADIPQDHGDAEDKGQQRDLQKLPLGLDGLTGGEVQKRHPIPQEGTRQHVTPCQHASLGLLSEGPGAYGRGRGGGGIRLT